MATFTFASLKLGARERADMVNSSFISDAEEARIINESVNKLYDLLITNSENWRIKSTEISVSTNEAMYSLPQDFYKIKAMDEVLSANQMYPMRRFQFADRSSYQTLPVRSLIARLWYYPTIPQMESDDDEISMIQGWERYIHLDAAIQYLNKEESDPTAVLAERMDMEERITSNSLIRDGYRSERVIDVTLKRSFNSQIYSDTRYDIVGSDMMFYSSDLDYIG